MEWNGEVGRVMLEVAILSKDVFDNRNGNEQSYQKSIERGCAMQGAPRCKSSRILTTISENHNAKNDGCSFLKAGWTRQ